MKKINVLVCLLMVIALAAWACKNSGRQRPDNEEKNVNVAACATDCAVTGQICENGTCVGCEADVECGTDKICQASVCVAATPPPAPTPECSPTVPCGDGKTCQEGHCVAETPPPAPECSPACASNQTCENGQCKDIQGWCEDSNDCTIDQKCTNNACVTAELAKIMDIVPTADATFPNCKITTTWTAVNEAKEYIIVRQQGGVQDLFPLYSGATSLTNSIVNIGVTQSCYLGIAVLDTTDSIALNRKVNNLVSSSGGTMNCVNMSPSGVQACSVQTPIVGAELISWDPQTTKATVKISWSPMSGATFYRIYHNTTQISPTIDANAVNLAPEFIDGQSGSLYIPSHITYCYRATVDYGNNQFVNISSKNACVTVP